VQEISRSQKESKMDYYTSYTFDVCINGKPVKNYFGRDEGVYIEGRRGSEFTLKFRNKTYEKVLVVLSVDGLSVMDGKPASEKSGGYLCDPCGTIDIPGWRINADKVAKFQFQPQGDRDNKTYVEELASEGFNVDPANQGVIGIMVFKREPFLNMNLNSNIHHYHHYEQPYPYLGALYNNRNDLTLGVGTCLGPDSQVFTASGLAGLNSCNFMSMSQAQNASVSASAATPLGTAFGEDKKFATSEVEFKRQSIATWTGAIFYDTKNNLQKKGIVFDEDYVRTPNAFPAKTGCYVPKSRR
jgi:hypothetical protein